MSWGERSCAQGKPCSHNPTIYTCNVNCPGYRWDGFTKPDSGEAPPLSKAQERLLRKYSEANPPAAQDSSPSKE